MSVSVLFVCLGNICRSPTAEAVLRRKVEDAGLKERIFIDSAGTSDWEAGNPPDSRSVAAASKRGYSFEGQRARQLTRADLVSFNYVIAMDRQNLLDISRLQPESQPRLLLDFAPDVTEDEVPDPWYHGRFEEVLDMIEAGVDGLMTEIRERQGSV